MSSLSLNDVKASGAHLMNRRGGLYLLVRDDTQKFHSSLPLDRQVKDQLKTSKTINLIVHGYGSRGYEWIYAAHELVQTGHTYVYRWDWTLCPKEAGAQLLDSVKRLIGAHPNHDIRAFGHSYGGVILSIAAARYKATTDPNFPLLTAHLIAAPLAGHPKLESRCEVPIRELTQSHKKTQAALHQNTSQRVSLFQWRTIKAQDGAFKDLKVDPQVVDWSGVVTRLPKTYKGRRLGHNWSISAVVDLIKERVALE